MSDQTAERLTLGLLAFLALAVMMVLSAFPNAEPALPRCPADGATITRCQP